MRMNMHTNGIEVRIPSRLKSLFEGENVLLQFTSCRSIREIGAEGSE